MTRNDYELFNARKPVSPPSRLPKQTQDLLARQRVKRERRARARHVGAIVAMIVAVVAIVASVVSVAWNA